MPVVAQPLGSSEITNETETDLTGLPYFNGSTVQVATETITTPVDADVVGVSDSQASGLLKKLTWANLKATLKTYFDAIYPADATSKANAAQAAAVQRGNHTGTQTASTISDFNSAAVSATAASYIPLATSVANRIPKRNGTTGALTDSGITIDGSNNVTGVAAITVSGDATLPVVRFGSAWHQQHVGNDLIFTRSGVSSYGKWLSNGNLILSNDSTGFTDNGAKLQVSGAITAGGNLTLSAVGKFIQYKAGTGQRAGNATLVGGTVTVTNTSVTANTVVTLSRKTAGGTIGNLTYTLSAGASFTINSDNVLDTSVISYELVEVA